MRTAAACVRTLEGYGMAFGPQFLPLMSQQNLASHRSASLLHLTSLGPDANLSNTACFFTAHGEGMLAGYFAERFLQSVAAALDNVTNIFAKIIVLLALLPLILIVLLINDLIPLRIMMPTGTLVLANGTISSIGLQGVKREKIGADHAQVNLSWFTGITLNILPINNHSAFTFVAGFAMKTEGYIA